MATGSAICAVEARLDYLGWLGVGAPWLSPIFPSPMADFGCCSISCRTTPRTPIPPINPDFRPGDDPYHRLPGTTKLVIDLAGRG